MSTQQHFSEYIQWDTVLMRRLTWDGVNDKNIGFSSPTPSHNTAVYLLSVSLFIFEGPRCEYMQQCLLKSEYFLSGTAAAAQDYFLGPKSRLYRTIRKGEAAKPKPRRATALLSEH